MIRFFSLAIISGLTAIGSVAAAQDSYVEVKGALDWIAKLSQNVTLGTSPTVTTLRDATNSTYLSSGETLFRTEDPAWHITVAYGWKLNDLISLETEGSYGQKVWNDNEFNSSLGSSVTTGLAPSTGESIISWDDANSNDAVDNGELENTIPEQDETYVSAMFNAIYTPKLTDELTLGLGIGGGLIYTGLDPKDSDKAGSSSAFLPGYQLKAKLIFDANATTTYLIEAGFQAGLSGESTDSRNAGAGAGDYTSSYSHFWTSAGVGYKF